MTVITTLRIGDSTLSTQFNRFNTFNTIQHNSTHFNTFQQSGSTHFNRFNTFNTLTFQLIVQSPIAHGTSWYNVQLLLAPRTCFATIHRFDGFALMSMSMSRCIVNVEERRRCRGVSSLTMSRSKVASRNNHENHSNANPPLIVDFRTRTINHHHPG